MNFSAKHYLESLDVLLIKDSFNDSSRNNKMPGESIHSPR